MIKEIYVSSNSVKINKLLLTIENAYKKAPYFPQVYPIIENVLTSVKDDLSISDIAIESVLKTSEYLEIDTHFELSSEKQSKSKGLDKEDRILSICKNNKASVYINPIGGNVLYSKEKFANNNLKLKFLKPDYIKYKQYTNKFVPNLSIIDIMMFNSISEIKELLNQYQLA